LLDRTTRTVSLTDEGRRLYEEVKPHLDGIEHATMTASGAVSAVRGRLKGDIDPFFLPAVLGGRLGTFCERHPDFSEMRAAMRPVTQRIAQIKREGEQELKSLQNEGQPLAS
jgi:DNA-binding transcriptional LysR family regulator